MEPERRPIGYWLKHLDRLIDEAFERAFDADGLTRRHWQVLNTLAAGPSTAAALTAALQPFVQEDAKAVEVIINDFFDRGGFATFLMVGSRSPNGAGRCTRQP
jgi:hypothetical protein